MSSDDDAARRDNPQSKPALPRLNSQSRAPSSSLGSEADPDPEPEPGQPAAHQQKPSPAGAGADGMPIRVKDSKEIPIPIPQRRSATSDEGAEREEEEEEEEEELQDGEAGSSQDHTSESESEANAGHAEQDDTPKARVSPSLKTKDESDGQNPTIQIPKVTPVSSGMTLPADLARLAEGLEDKCVDEFGNILEWDGRVLGRVEGDLPSMVGRPISATGEVLSEQGDVVGYVAENETLAEQPPPPQPIQGMGEGLRVDHLGNILDDQDKVVGRFNGDHMDKAVQQQQRHGGGGGGRSGQAGTAGEDASEGSGSHQQRTKPSATPSPSEIYLDVKSTNDGVQLIIKIPTVFNGGGNPNIHIGTGS